MSCASIPFQSAFSPNLQKSFSLGNWCAHSLFHMAAPCVCSPNDTDPGRLSCPLPLLLLPASTALLRHFRWGCPREGGLSYSSTQSTAGEQAGEITKKTKTQSISILYHTGSISLQHCRLQNFYHISQYRSSEINQRDESIFHVLKLVLTATGSHKTLLSIKEMDFLFRVWSKAARALLKQFMLKVLKHSASRFKPRSATGNHRGASFGRGNYPMFYTWDYPMFNICNFIFSVSPDNSYS